VSLWTPPQIKVESTTRPAYGTDDHDRPVGEISGLYLLAVMQALQQAVASQVQTEHPTPARHERDGGLAGGEAWLNLLNQSCAAAPHRSPPPSCKATGIAFRPSFASWRFFMLTCCPKPPVHETLAQTCWTALWDR
jgi:hypothetical protein